MLDKVYLKNICLKMFPLKDFDKKLRFFECQYKQNKVEQIDNLNTNNSAKFWDQVSRLGPRKQTVIHMKVQTEDGISFEQEVVSEKWKDDFSSLYNSELDINDYDVNFYDSCCINSVTMETDAEHSNVLINDDISYNEVEKAVKQKPKGK